MQVATLDYKVTRSLDWQCLIVPKNRRTRRVVRPLDVWATIATSATSTMPITCTITQEGGVLLSLTQTETQDLAAGTYDFDVVGTIRQRDYTDSSGWTTITIPLAKGTITVSDNGLISTLGSNEIMEIRFNKGEDYYTTFEWTDDTGALLACTDAYMQAKDTGGTTVIDLRWYDPAPDEVAIGNLAGDQRGYLSPYEGKTLELHISDLNTVPVGTHSFDLFVKGEDGRWTMLAKGNVVVEASVSTKPA